MLESSNTIKVLSNIYCTVKNPVLLAQGKDIALTFIKSLLDDTM